MKVLSITKLFESNKLSCKVVIYFANKYESNDYYHNGSNLLKSSVLDKIYSEVESTNANGILLYGEDILIHNKNDLKDLYNFITCFKHNFPEKNIWLYYINNYYEINELQSKIIKECIILKNDPLK